ncbi:formate dehydrogenase accessory sulfurtransferase FdhD [Rathayibacter oskolensis]|uniref:formate dehydrogenase accessory sulfurtransferase FdhD n=1 Tax=Rathayibacter oskolensis TaxID=1891671 RepID=UPI003467361D
MLTATEQLAAMRYCASGSGPAENTYNVVDATVRGGREAVLLERERSVSRRARAGSAASASLDAVTTDSAWTVAEDPLRVSRELLVELPERPRDAQAVFERTGGVHAAGLFDADGSLLVLREDVGRHNAVDKVVGWGLREGRLPLRGACCRCRAGRRSSWCRRP